jgi:hypothetical protein
MNNPLLICYHGTGEKAAAIIRKKGFGVGTYFAKHLEDAIEFGGPYVFEVMFTAQETPFNWQFKVTKPVPRSKIIGLKFYNKATVMINNITKRQRVFKSNGIYISNSNRNRSRSTS